MQQPEFPADEEFRISTLRELNLLDTPAEERFDRLARIAEHVFDVPIVLISLIDSDRQWFKSTIGVDLVQTPRSISFCGHTILEREILIINDTHLDHRFADNPLVLDAPGIRFYAGMPIHAINGHKVGTMCILDVIPRQFNSTDRHLFSDLVELVEKEINFPDLITLNDRLLRSEKELLDSLVQLRNTERHERTRSKSLELISRGYPLHEVLSSIASEVENSGSDVKVTIEVDTRNDGEARVFHGKREAREPQAGIWKCTTEAIKSTNGELLGRLTSVRPHVDGIDRGATRLIEESAILASIAIERDLADRMIWKQANYDGLTTLPNRNLLHERLGQELNKARRHRLQLALMFIDLDYFKQVNDTLGHVKGDELLVQAAARLSACIRDSDTVARLGGDEFTVLAVEISCPEDVERIAQKVLQELSSEFVLGDDSVYLSASIGIAFYPDHGEDTDTLISSADRAMYDAKTSGRNRFKINSD
jgi:diguanylate cyclase (GGDEF)-like protein